EKPVAERLSRQYPFTHFTLPSFKNFYGVAFPKDSSLVLAVNQALQRLKENGALENLKKKWDI
ncbi:MAG: ABC transporter substrate-binding protein, partial [Alphaproteobacteria bacterium]